MARRHRGQKHPVEDFLFTYYTLKPAQLKRWHPGAGTVLLDAAERAWERFYRPLTGAELEALGLTGRDGAVTVDDDALRDRRANPAAPRVDGAGRVLSSRAGLSPNVAPTGISSLFIKEAVSTTAPSPTSIP
ncbi:hypothetical protein [Kocuria rosea]|uniref:hypothetical protein n=1 Tax=Kocuria rosea TaxID=1275 RepID=UPI003DA76319